MNKIVVACCFLFVSGIAFSQSQQELLDEACKQKSDSLLNIFFTKWSKEAKPRVFESNSVEKDALELFKLIYDPLHVSKVCGYSSWDSLYSKSKYVVVQNDLKINILYTDSLKRQKVFSDSVLNTIKISDFRPELNYKGSKVLFLTPEYREMLGSHLNSSKFISVANQQKTGSVCVSKQAMLRKYIMVIQSRDGAEWYIESHPYISAINFNRSMNMARIDFRLIYQKGAVYYIKEKGEWKLIWSGLLQN